jgi:hypothetical protein
MNNVERGPDAEFNVAFFDDNLFSVLAVEVTGDRAAFVFVEHDGNPGRVEDVSHLSGFAQLAVQVLVRAGRVEMENALGLFDLVHGFGIVHGRLWLVGQLLLTNHVHPMRDEVCVMVFKRGCQFANLAGGLEFALQDEALVELEIRIPVQVNPSGAIHVPVVLLDPFPERGNALVNVFGPVVFTGPLFRHGELRIFQVLVLSAMGDYLCGNGRLPDGGS